MTSQLKPNGRVDITQNVPHTSFPLYESNQKDSLPVENSIRTIQEESLLSKAFFSKKNLNIIQNAIRKNVFDLNSGKYIVDKQSDIELEIIMRSMFLQYSENRTDDIAQQITALNDYVVQYSVPIVNSNLHQYLQYKKDVSTLTVPLRHSVNMSIKGDKSLMLNPFL
jgi:hypothetical protein